MSTMHQFPVQRNQPPAAPEEVADALGVAIDAAVGADASFEAREAAAVALTNEATRLFLERELLAIADGHGTHVEGDGVIYQRHEPGIVRYFTLCGAVDIERWTDREMGVRNGPTLVPLDLDAGLVERTTPARGFRIALGYAKDHMRSCAEDMTADHRCPPSRSTLERVAKAIGTAATRVAPRIEPRLRRAERVPDGAVAISLGLDRTSVPMEEDVPAGETPATRRKTRHTPYTRKKPAPVNVNYRMAYVGTISFHDADGTALATRRCLGAQLAISVNNCPPPRDPRSRMTSFKRTQRKYVQKAYRVRNWREYETGLRARGSLTVWLGRTDGKLANWNSPRPTRRKPGRQRQYSNHAIETTVTLGLVFGLASRQTEGFLRSLLTLLNLDNDVPDHSTISRRKARLGKVASYERRTVKPVHLLIDSSGLSVHVGQLRTPPKARDYRKLHLAVDEHTSDVVACELTSKRARDASRVASLVGQIERPIASAKADAAYDTGDVYKTLENHRAHRAPKVLIPPRKGAQLALDSAGTRQRNRNIRARSRVGKWKWYVASGYSRRSKVETTFHRYKAILGSAMRARGLASQRVEVRLGCKILNTMTALGIPDGEMIG